MFMEQKLRIRYLCPILTTSNDFKINLQYYNSTLIKNNNVERSDSLFRATG